MWVWCETEGGQSPPRAVALRKKKKNCVRPPYINGIMRWYEQFREIGSVGKIYSTGQPRRSDEDVDCVRHAFTWSLKQSISWASAQLQMLQTTVHRILRKSQCFKPYKLQVVQKVAAHDKQLRLQFVAHTYAQILEHDNFLSHIVFIDEAKFHISGRVSWLNYVIWAREPSREHSNLEHNSPKVNMWCALTHERVIGPFFFDEDIIKRNSFLDMLVSSVLL
jgi:hypothetical protein